MKALNRGRRLLSNTARGPAESPAALGAMDYCISLVKLHDFDNYLAGLLVPKTYRGSYFAIRAFHVELALIKDQARRNALTGRVRFQFWRDVVDDTFSTAKPSAADASSFSSSSSSSSKTPVARALRTYATDLRPAARYFQRAVDARQRELNQNQHETLDELEDHAEQTHSSMLYTQLHAIGLASANVDDNLAHAASHVGVCAGIVTLLRSMAYHASQGDCVLPKDVMLKHGASMRTVISGPSSPEDLRALQDSVHDVASQAFGHLEQAKKLFNSESRHRRALGIHALWPAVRCQLFLDELKKAEFNPFDPAILQATQSPSYLMFQLKLMQTRWFPAL